MSANNQMRDLAEVLDASRLGEPCTEQELRCAAEIQRQLLILIRSSLAKWSVEDINPLVVKLKSKNFFEMIQNSLTQPMDKYLGPHNMPGNPEIRERMQFANKVFEKAQSMNQEK